MTIWIQIRLLPREQSDQVSYCLQYSLPKIISRREEQTTKVVTGELWVNVCLVFQIYDMILVRHGLMIVGDPLGGKTSSFKVLADSLADLHSQNLMDEFGVRASLIYSIFPCICKCSNKTVWM